MQEERENKVYTEAKGACVVGDSNPLLPGWVISCCSACCDAKTQLTWPVSAGCSQASSDEG